MTRHIACAMALCLMTLPALAWNGAPQVEAAPAPAVPVSAPNKPAASADLGVSPERVVIEGKRPGPGVWKVSKDGHVMYVFGLYSPLPQKMECRKLRVTSHIRT